MNAFKNITAKKFLIMCLGNVLIGFSIGLFKVANFGLDVFTSFNEGAVRLINSVFDSSLSFGTYQLCVNLILLIIMLCYYRDGIGAGTLVNMVFVGYICDFTQWGFAHLLDSSPSIILRVCLLIASVLIICLGAALYIETALGISPFDSIALMIQKRSGGKLSYRVSRVASDIVFVSVGAVLCKLSGGNIDSVVGIATVIVAFFTGPLVQFYREKVAAPWIGEKLSK